MRNGALRSTSVVVVCILGLALTAGLFATKNGRSEAKHDVSEKDRAAIEELHRLDVETTLTDKADELAKLWDNDAVRIQPGKPPEVTKAVIYANDKRWETSNTTSKTLCYKAEIKDLQIAGDWAFEWGYFSYRDSSEAKPGRGKVLRVMKRQADGSWKFARVIGFPEKDESAAPMSQPCQ
jgi:ketosteroid isomerase-like protein